MSFNITYADQDDKSDVHYAGWKYVYDNLLPLNDPKSKLLLDLYADKTFNWKNTSIKLPYTQSWMGVCHHTFNVEFSDNNLYNMLNNKYFIDSVKHCKGLIVLSEHLQQQLIRELNKRNMKIEVYFISHPTKTVVPQFDLDRFTDNPNKKLVHIGAWLRNIFFFYNLTLSAYDFSSRLFSFCYDKENLQKVALKGNDMDNFFYTDEFINILRCINPRRHNKNTPVCRGGNGVDPIFNKWYSQYATFISRMKNSVDVLNRLTNEEYDELLTENIVIINLLDASACNTLIECVARCTPIIINKHPAVVEILGRNYPLYYNTQELDGVSENYYQQNKEIDELLSKKGIIKKANDYLRKLNKDNLSISNFKQQLVDVCKMAQK